MHAHGRFFGALVALVSLVAAPQAEAQLLPLPAALEIRLGAGLPTGEFGGGPAFTADPGPGFAIGLRVHPVPLLGLQAGYQATRFGCPSCREVGLDGHVLSEGLELAAHLAGPTPWAGLTPWLRGGILHQTLGFSGHGDRMTSRAAVGFTLGAGIAVPAGPIELSPGVHFQTVPAEFRFSEHPTRTLDASRLALDLGILFRF